MRLGKWIAPKAHLAADPNIRGRQGPSPARHPREGFSDLCNMFFGTEDCGSPRRQRGKLDLDPLRRLVHGVALYGGNDVYVNMMVFLTWRRCDIRGVTKGVEFCLKHV